MQRASFSSFFERVVISLFCSSFHGLDRFIVTFYWVTRDGTLFFVSIECSFRVTWFVEIQTWLLNLASSTQLGFNSRRRCFTMPLPTQCVNIPPNLEFKRSYFKENSVVWNEHVIRSLCIIYEIYSQLILCCEYKNHRVNHLLGSIIKERRLNINFKNAKEVIVQDMNILLFSEAWWSGMTLAVVYLKPASLFSSVHSLGFLCRLLHRWQTRKEQ